MSQKKIRVGIVFGGRSGEHEVSLASAKPYPYAEKRLRDVARVGERMHQWEQSPSGIGRSPNVSDPAAV